MQSDKEFISYLHDKLSRIELDLSAIAQQFYALKLEVGCQIFSIEDFKLRTAQAIAKRDAELAETILNRENHGVQIAPVIPEKTVEFEL